MKKLLAILLLTVGLGVSAQTEKGTVVIETAVLNNSAPSTGIGFTVDENDYTTVNVGLNGGYFVAPNFALKAGLGYGNTNGDNQYVAFRVGTEYFIASKYALETAVNVVSFQEEVINLSHFSAQLGYMWYVAPNFAVKPLVRYNIALNEESTSNLAFGVGFSLHLR